MGSRQRVFGETQDRFGRLDILHNNAGIGEGPGDWPAVSPERTASIIDVNLRGVVLGTRLALEPMQQGGGGVVINTASGGAFIPLPPQAVYVATKAGVVHFTRSCAPLAESHGVRVNCVCPGIVDTDMVRAVPPAVLEKIIAKIPVGRLGQAQDIARSVAFLVADEAGFITGSTLSVNGGQHMY